MQVFIPYKKSVSYGAFEETRLRKTIKGACERASIKWVESLKVSPEIAHFASPKDGKTLKKAKAKGIKTIVSAFYCENDPHAAFFQKKNGKTAGIPKKTLRFLNEADLVLVPNENAKSLAVELGVTSPIEVLPNAVNLKRFEPNRVEEDIFPRYFGIRPYENLAIAAGDCSDKKLMRSLLEIAALCPSVEIYFFCTGKSKLSRNLAMLLYTKKATPNLHLQPLVPDDVYRSALRRAKVYLILDQEKIDSVSALEAFASKTQVVAYGDQQKNPLIRDKETAFVFAEASKLSNYIDSLYRSEAEMTIIAGYEEAKRRSLQIMSTRLKAVYEGLLDHSL